MIKISLRLTQPDSPRATMLILSDGRTSTYLRLDGTASVGRDASDEFDVSAHWLDTEIEDGSGGHLG